MNLLLRSTFYLASCNNFNQPMINYNTDDGDQMNPGDLFSLGSTLCTSCKLGTGSVVMVYNVNVEQLNCDKLFNLLCLYGNVLKVSLGKFAARNIN